MTYIVKISLTIMLLCSFDSIAQKENNNNNRFEIEADPVAFIFNGYSLHLGYMLGHVRFDAGIFGINQPKFVLENKQFSVYSSGIGVKTDYLFRKNKGLFLGLQSDYVTDKIGLKASDRTQFKGATLGLRTGYRFMLGSGNRGYKGIYLVPWVALVHSFSPANVTENAQHYVQPRWSVFPTVHLGYRF